MSNNPQQWRPALLLGIYVSSEPECGSDNQGRGKSNEYENIIAPRDGPYWGGSSQREHSQR